MNLDAQSHVVTRTADSGDITLKTGHSEQTGKQIFKEATLLATVFDVQDDWGDVFRKGAFAKTLQERIPKGLIKFLNDHTTDVAHTLGNITAGHETKQGLVVTSSISAASGAQETALKMKEGIINQISVGVKPITTNPIRHGDSFGIEFHEAMLRDVSALPFAAFEDTRVLTCKTAVPFQALPLAPLDTDWNEAAAKSNVAEWATNGDGTLNLSRYLQAFLSWNDLEPDLIKSYRLPIANIIRGRLTAIPRGIINAAFQIMREQDTLPKAEFKAIQTHLTRYYELMRQTNNSPIIAAPWEKSVELSTIISLAATGQSPHEQAADTIRQHITAFEKNIKILEKVLTPSSDPCYSEEDSAAAPPSARTARQRAKARKERLTRLKLEHT